MTTSIRVLESSDTQELEQVRQFFRNYAAWLGVVPAAIVGGLCTLGVVGGWMLAFQTLRKVDRFEEAAQATGAAPSP